MTARFLAFAGLVVACQAALLVFGATLRHDTVTLVAVLPLVAALVVPAGVGFAMVGRFVALEPTRVLLGLVLGAGFAMRLMHIGHPPVLEDDHFRYLWDGGLLANGLSPYRFAPTDVLAGGGVDAAWTALARGPARALLEQVNFPELRSIYPGTAAAAFALAHLIAPWSVEGLRVIALAAEAATLALLLLMLSRLGRSPLWVALYWLNPLVVLVLVNQVHVDVLLPPLLLGAVLAVDRRRPMLAGGLSGLAIGVKIWPVLLVPLLVRALWPDARAAARGIVVGALVTAVAMAPLLLSALGEGSGLTAYAGGWAMNNGFHAWASWLLFKALGDSASGEPVLRAGLAGVVGLVALAMAWRPVSGLEDLAGRVLAIAAALFYLSPAQFPWYLVWFLPFAVALGVLPLVLSTVLMPAYYLFFPLALTGHRDLFQYGLAFAHAVPVLAWLLWRRLAR